MEESFILIIMFVAAVNIVMCSLHEVRAQWEGRDYLYICMFHLRNYWTKISHLPNKILMSVG
jgi:hypothetical protein